MEKESYEWLSHLENAIPPAVYSHKINMYTIALEGWRRGLKLRFYKFYKGRKLQIRYSLSSSKEEYLFDGSRGNKVSSDVIELCINKDETNRCLSEAKVPAPIGKNFINGESEEEIIDYAKSLGFPLVLKPTNGSLGKGVIVNIKSEEALNKAVKYVRKKLRYSRIMIEKYITGEDIRVYIVGNKVIGAIKRIPANIVGDGEHTILKLIEKKNNYRKKNPHLFYRSIKLDKEILDLLISRNLSLETVPKKGERIFLRGISNISAGGDPIDVTDKITPEIREIAINAAKAVGAVQCGVDIIRDEKTNTGVVIEINSKAHIGSHLFPVAGEARDIPKSIIDFYFPETITEDKTENYFYFDYKNIIYPLSSGAAEEILVPPLPQRKIITSYIVQGNVGSRRYQRWIQRQAIKFKLNGFVKQTYVGELLIVVGGEKEAVSKFSSIIVNKSPTEFEMKSFTEQEWSKPISVGFELKEKINAKVLNDLEKELKQIQNEKREVIQKLETQIKINARDKAFDKKDKK